MAEGQVGKVDQEEYPSVPVEQSEDALVKELLALAERNNRDSEPQFKSNEEIDRAFVDGKI